MAKMKEIVSKTKKDNFGNQVENPQFLQLQQKTETEKEGKKEWPLSHHTHPSDYVQGQDISCFGESWLNQLYPDLHFS